MNLKTIIKSELLFESLEDRLKSAYVKWCKKTKSKIQQTVDDIYDADGYVEELDEYSVDFSDPNSEMYQKAEELYAKEDYEGILKMIVDHQCRGGRVDWEFKEWFSYRNLMKSSDIFQYKNEEELKVELRDAKEKSFTKKLKKALAGEDFDKIWENDDMLIVVPKSHVGACKFGQGTRWCTASKTTNLYFDSYYEKGILYRVLQKNDNYKELFSNFQMNNKLVSDIENLSKVSINLRRKQDSMSMVDKVDYAYGNKSTLEFLNSLPSEGYKAIKNYQSLNEQSIKKIIREEVDDFDWVRDIKTNDTIAREIYDTLKWHKVPDVTTDFIQVPWVDIVFAVRKRTMSDSKIPLITPSTFYKRFTKYVREHYNIFDTDTDVKEIYNKVRELMGDKIHGTITESNDFDWVKGVEPKLTKGLVLCPNHEKFSGGCKEVVKVDEVKDGYAPDKMVYLKDLETNNLYAETITNMMKWLSDDEYVISYQTLRESKNKLIKESGVENYLQSIASMTSGNQKKYYQWILNNLEQVPVVSYRSNEELKEKIDRFVKKMRRFGDFCQKKGCFDTAYNTAMYVPGVHYIEGYVQSMIPIVHAWNYLPEEGIYFDLINDIAWEEDSHFNEYYKVIDLDKSGVLKWSSKTGYGGGFMENPQFINSILS